MSFFNTISFLFLGPDGPGRGTGIIGDVEEAGRVVGSEADAVGAHLTPVEAHIHLGPDRDHVIQSTVGQGL